MTNILLYFAQFSILFFQGILGLIAFSNLLTLRRLGSYPLPDTWPSVSILVPARDEEINIAACLQSLLAQQYPAFQVLALDDNSSDATGTIIRELAAKDCRLTALQGRPLPAGWLGKHWACHQLAQAATGELLLFTDADTRHHPLALRDAVSVLMAEKADMLTALPREEVETWAERLLVPLIFWSIFTFVPLALANRLRYAVLSAAIGQFMLFRRAAFEQIGGYHAVRRHVADDLALARRIKSGGFRWRLVDGSTRVRCRMYRNFQQVYQGLSKNLFAAFGYKTPYFVFVWCWLAFVFLTPWLIVLAGLTGQPLPPNSLILAAAAIASALLLWGITYWRFGFPRYLTLLYPFTVMLSVFIALRSLILTRTNQATWKERTLVR